MIRAALFLAAVAGLAAHAAHASPDTDRYQIGSEWGKRPVTAADIGSGTRPFARAAMATAMYSGATAFYLGKFDGHHIAATNHHVQNHMWCHGFLNFSMLGATVPCKKVLGHWPEIDLGLIEIEPGPREEALLAPVAGNFAFDRPLTPGMPLITIGHGIAENPSRRLMANQDSDCKVFSAEGDFRLLGDPDTVNPGSYQAWSFANGCDVSHGDSGSAMVDRDSGDVVGIIWTGQIPKSPEIKDTRVLDDLLRTQSPAIWKELSYAVPAAKIREVLARVIATDASLDPETRSTLSAIIH